MDGATRPRIHDQSLRLLARSDQRYTTGRRAIVDVLAGCDAPATITTLLDRSEALSQSSTYRNLLILERCGVVRRVPGQDGLNRFQLAEAVTGEYHHQFICTDCGAHLGLEIPSDLRFALEDFVAKVSHSAAFLPATHRVDVVGLCARCR